jgi:hypothetical protein
LTKPFSAIIIEHNQTDGNESTGDW